MRPKSLILLVLALGCGLVASIGISQVIENRKAGNAPVETVEIYVAMTDIGTGDPINAQMIKLEAWPKDKVNALQGAITNAEELIDCRPRTTIFAGEPILEQKLADGVSSATERIREGFRAVAVKVDSVTSIGGVLQPGDRVDVQVYLRRDPANGIHAAAVRTLLENVKVFAVNDILDRNAENGQQSISARTVTLELTPHQSELVTLASKIGSLQLTARNASDEDKGRAEGVDISFITGARTTEKAVPQDDPSSQLSLVEQAQKAITEAMASRKQSAGTTTSDSARGKYQMEIIRGSNVAVALFDRGKFVSEQSFGGNAASSDTPASNDSITVESFHDDAAPESPKEDDGRSGVGKSGTVDQPD